MSDRSEKSILPWASLFAALVSVSGQAGLAAIGPCDIYQAGGTPCVAAHSTVRALYGSYSGDLYQVQRASDNATKNIPVLEPGGFADASVQESFCSGTTCTISYIYDQSPRKNDLPVSPPVHWLANGGKAADAAPGKAKVGGHTVYGVYVQSDVGNTYRNNNTKGVATGDDPESMYMVADGNRYNGRCCFDYGNVETTGNDDGKSTMEALEWGNMTTWSGGSGNGPWILADLEDGVYAGDQLSGGVSANTPLVANYATLMLKGFSGDHYALKAADAQSGPLSVEWDGKRPPGYSPMRKEGAVELGTGGDGSAGGIGTFFEGAMVTGVAPDSTDAAVQANIVAAGYGSDAPIVTIPAHRDTVFNGGFGQGSLDWTFNVWGGGAHGSVVNGEYKIQIDSIGQHNSSIQLVQNGIILEQGRSYLVEFDAYSSATRTLEANVEQDVSPWTSYLPALQNFDLTTTKTTYSYAFNMTNPTDSNGRVTFNVGASTETVFLDDISIKVIPTGIRASTGSLARGLRWSAGVLLVPGTESGRLQIIDSRGQSRIVSVEGGRAITGALPSGIYQTRRLGSTETQRFSVLP